MLKIIKKKKDVSTNELFKYITMNAHTLLAGKKFHIFRSKTGHEVIIDEKGNVNFSFMHYTPEDLFTVEVEEPITEDTIFDTLVAIKENDSFVDIHKDQTINGVTREYGIYEIETERIYALIDNKLELIWESDNQ